MKTRQIVLIDAENLAGSGHLTPITTRRVCKALQRVVFISRNDIVLVGGDKHNAFQLVEIARHFGGQIVVGTGPDGGDRALVQAFNQIPNTAWNYTDFPITRLVIASGDHYFSLIAQETRSKGRQVMTICNQLSLSKSLAKSSTGYIHLHSLKNSLLVML